MTPEQAAALRAPFDPSLVQTKPGRGNPRYVGHAHVTDRLLQVDPGWSWEPMAVDEWGAPLFDGNEGIWIWLIVCGTRTPGYGAPERPNQGADGVKQAISDAIKVAAMRRGLALDLWVGGDTPKEHVQTTDAASSAQIRMIQMRMKDAGITERSAVLDRIGEIVERPIDSSKELTAREASLVIGALQ